MYPFPAETPEREYTAIIGVDLSLTGTGVVIVDPNGQVIGERLIVSKWTGAKRLVDVRSNIASAVTDALLQFDVLVVQEEYGASGNWQMKMGPLHGVVDEFWYEHNVPVLKVNPMHLKQFVFNKGTAQKEDIKLKAFQLWNYQNPSNDVVDAYCMAQIGRMLAGQTDIRTQFQRDMLKKILIHARDFCPDLSIEKAFPDRYAELDIANAEKRKRKGKGKL